MYLWYIGLELHNMESLRRRLLLFLLGISATFLQAQSLERQRTIDSLKHRLATVQSDTAKIYAMVDLAKAHETIDSAKTFSYAFNALAKSQNISFTQGIMNARVAIGSAYMDYYEIEKAEKELKTAIKLGDALIKIDSSRRTLKQRMRAYFNLGVNYSYKGDYNKQIEYSQLVIPMAEYLKEYGFLANLYTNLGIVHENLGDSKSAYDSYQISGRLQEKYGKDTNIIFDKLSFAQVLYELDSIPEMVAPLNIAKKYLDKNPKDPDWQLYHTQKGLYYAGLAEYKKAIAEFDKAKEVIQKLKLYGYLNLLNQRYAVVYERMGDYKMAGDYIGKYLDYKLEINDYQGAFQGHYKRSQFYAADGNYKSAYFDLLTAVDIYDSLEIQENLKSITELELKYDTSEKEKEILLLKNERNETALSLEKKKSQAYLLGGISSILLLLLFGGYYFYNQRLRKARKKERQQEAEVLLLKQEQQNKVFSAMIEGQEKERKRLAIDLHDGLGGRLSGISMNLSKLDTDEPKKYPKKQLQKVMKDLDDSLTELRMIARNMMPETLVKFGLQAALKDYCSSMTGSETKVTLQFYGTDKGIGINQQVTMYRVIQELINNAVKHAQASEVLVQYMREGDSVDITVEDNGTGFNKNEELAHNNSGMGLSNLQTRVAYLKGNIDFESEENEGTTVNVHLNINAA